MTRRLINTIALWGPVLLIALIMPALCHADSWEFNQGYNTWTVTIGHKVDHEMVEQTRKDVDVKIELVTYGHDWCRMVLTDTGTTDWAKVRKWVKSL